MYAFTDTAFYASLSIALINLLPAYPLDGGRVLHCALARIFSKTQTEEAKVEKLLENQDMFKTPIVRNGKKATLGYCPDEWKKWEEEK